LSSVEKELVEEVSALRKELREIMTIKEVQSLSSFSIKGLTDKMKLTGILLAEGNWGDIFWSGDEIKKMVKKYQDKLNKMELTAEHEKNPEWGDKSRGYHEKVNYNDQLKAAIYEGIVDDAKAIKAIKDKIFRATSMRIKFTPRFVNGRKEAVDLVPINNTLTSFPACKTCSIFNWKDLSDEDKSEQVNEIEYYGIKEKDLSKEKEEYSDVNTMSEEIEFEDIEIEPEEKDLMTKYFELKSDLVGVLPDGELGDKEGMIKLELMTEDEAVATGKTIVYYYPQGKYRNRVRMVNRKLVQGEFSIYPVYRSGTPIPYSLLAKPSKVEEVEAIEEQSIEETETTQELNKEEIKPTEGDKMSKEKTVEEIKPDETKEKEVKPEETKPTEEVVEKVEETKPEEKVEEVKEPEKKEEVKPEEKIEKKPEALKIEDIKKMIEDVVEEKLKPKQEEATIVTTPESTPVEPTKPAPKLNIDDWVTPEKAAALLLYREKKDAEED